MLLRPKDSMKGQCYAYGGYKQKNKVYFVYLACKLAQDSYG